MDRGQRSPSIYNRRDTGPSQSLFSKPGLQPLVTVHLIDFYLFIVPYHGVKFEKIPRADLQWIHWNESHTDTPTTLRFFGLKK